MGADEASSSGSKVFCSENRPNQWLEVKFYSNALVPSGYVISSEFLHGKGGPPREWVLEGLAVNGAWIVLDEHKEPWNFNMREKNSRTLHLQIKSNVLEEAMPVKRVRLRQTGLNDAFDHCLVISHFELYGMLISGRMETEAEQRHRRELR